MFNINLKHVLLISALSLSASAWANPTVLATRTKQVEKTTKSTSYNLLAPSTKTGSKYEQAITKFQNATINTAALKALIDADAPLIKLAIPTTEGVFHAILKRHDIYSTDFKAQVRNSDGTFSDAPYKKGDFYRGYILENENSIVALSFYDNEIGGIFSISGLGNFNITLDKYNPGANNENYIIFNDKDVINAEKRRSGCDFNESFQIGEAEGADQTAEIITDNGSCRNLKLSLYADYQVFLANNSNLVNSQNYLTTLFNGSATLFENENIHVELSNATVNTTQDNIPGTNSEAVLTAFGEMIQRNTTGDMMQIVTGHTNNNGSTTMGGLAWLDVLCRVPAYNNANQAWVGPFSMVNNIGLDNIPFAPVYSWDITASNHEFGHNIGSNHTQACVWNGNNTAIDGCIDSEGRCPRGPIPNLGEGTIMSYCHLTPIGTDLNNGYGPQPGDLIRRKVASARCLTDTATRPMAVVDTASINQIGNNVCESNGWWYVYDNKNDADPVNDEIVLIIQKSGALANVDITTAEVGVVTNSFHGTTNTNEYGTLDYALYSDLRTINRSFYIKTPTPLSGDVSVKFLFTDKDFQDLRYWFPFIGSSESYMAQIFTNEAVFNNPTIADTSTIKLLDHKVNQREPNSWSSMATPNSYTTAYIRYSGNFYGGTLAFGENRKNLSTKGITADIAKIYPNPATNVVNIELTAQQKANIQVIDNLGRVLKTIPNAAQNTQIDIANFAVGIYTLKIEIDGQQYFQKVVKH